VVGLPEREGFPGVTLRGFELVEHPGARVWATGEAVPWVRYVLESGTTLHAAAAEDRDAVRMEGRRPVYVIPAKVGKNDGTGPGTWWAVRHYARGGRVFRVLGDRYFVWGSKRPLHEARASEAARARGIPTPRVQVAAVYPAGPFYRADLVTDFVHSALDLVEALFDTRRKGLGGAVERQDALRTAGHLLRQMADAGLRHKDIHAGNILLEWQGAAPTPHLLDLDRCEVAPAGSSLSPRPMLRRLQRSLRRWENRTGLRLSEKEWSILEQATMG
jgi:hypothetical protein